jgi:hypothetical protein
MKQHTDASGDGWGCTIEEYGKGVVDYNYGLFTPSLSAHTSNYVPPTGSRFAGQRPAKPTFLEPFY